MTASIKKIPMQFRVTASGPEERCFPEQNLMNVAAQGGFTLFEVLVALAIVAVAMAAGLRAAAMAADSSIMLRQHVLAVWVAQNRLAVHRAFRNWPVATTQGTEWQAGSEFVWKETVSPTPMPMFRRIQVDVAEVAHPQRRLYRLTDFYLSGPLS